MRICIVLRDITERGGGERVCANLANALALEHDVKIVSFYKGQKELSYPLNPKIQIEFLRNFAERSGGKIAYIFKKIFYRFLLTLEARRRFGEDEIIIANDRALAQFLKIKGKSYIRLWHLNFPKRKRNLSFFDSIVILSHKEENRWREIHNHIEVIPNFLPDIAKESTDYSQKICVSVGRMDRGDQKGFLRLIDIFAQLSDRFRDWKLHIVGEGKLREEIQNKINVYGLQNQIILKPFTYEIKKEYLNASFYVMSSYFEGFGMVLVESGNYGLPSVAFDIFSGPSDIIQEGKSGFLIEDNDLQNFASKMQTLMESEERRREMGQEAKKRIQSHFSQERILKKWNELFTQLQNHNLQLPQ